ncbi:MAG: MFS transporter [Rickettsiaceae bacterium]|nr:MFS transporter [Rickettsiaceae bacterium]
MSIKYNNTLKIFTDKQQFNIFILGIYSGMPLSMIYTTIIAWLKLSDISLEVITSFAIARIFYSLKMFWAPAIDNVKIPFLYKIGRRKSWMTVMIIIIAFIACVYSLLDPQNSISEIFFLTIILGIASATLDIAIDAYRIDNIEKDQLAIAAANAVFGYRIGNLIVGAGALYIAEQYGWKQIFLTIGLIYFVGIIFIYYLKEKSSEQFFRKELTLKNSILEPFVDFFKRKYAILILLAITFYKLGDAMLGVVATPFYIEIGFSLKEISGIVKIYGFMATILGCYIGGILVYQYGNIKSLIIGGIAQSLTNLMFIWLNSKGHNINALIFTITTENIASGLGSTALISYLSCLCNRHFSATQYALLSSCTGLFSHSIVSFGGQLVNILGWNLYFFMTTILALPGLLLLILLNVMNNKN